MNYHFLPIIQLLFFIIFFNNNLNAQDCLSNDCGDIIADAGLANGVVFVCEGEIFEVTVNPQTTTTNIDQIIWYWDDGEVITVSDFSNQSHLYTFTDSVACLGASQEVYNITLEIHRNCTDDLMSCHFQSSSVAVRFLPRANIDVSPLACIDEPVDFNDASCNADTYHWDFGDGNTSEEENPTHIYTTAGFYQVSLTATNECGEDMTVRTIEVVGFPVANASYVFDPSNGCTDLDVIFTNEQMPFENHSNATWDISPASGWIFSDTIFTENSWSNELTFFEPGIYEISLTVANSCGSDEWIEEIEVFEAPSAAFSEPWSECIATPGTSINIDFSDYLSITGSSCGFDWIITNNDNGNVVNSIEEFPILIFDEPGEYLAQLTIDGCTCGNISTSTLFYIQTPTTVTFDVLGENICLNTDPFQIMPNVDGGTWSGSPAIAADGIFTPSLANIGSNVLSYVVGTGACTSTASLTVNIIEAPDISLSAVPIACDSFDYTPDISFSGDYNTENWTLILEGGSIQNFDPNTMSAIPINEIGTHLFIAELGGDCGTAVDTITIEIIGSISSIDAGINDTVCIGDGIYNLSGIPSIGQWTEMGGSGNGLNQNTGELNLQEAGGGIHTYQYIYGAGTVCELSDEVIIEIIDLSGVDAGPDIVICAGISSFQLTGNSEEGGVWSGFGIDGGGTLNPSLLQADSTYTFTYCLSNASAGCNACDEMAVTLNPLPIADFQINGTNCVGETIDIENLSINACTYFWDFDNGQTSTITDPSPIYNTIGNYTITLIVESCLSCLDTLYFPISVTEPAVAAFSQNIDQGCAVLDVSFSNQSYGSDISFLWDFGNGQTSSDESPGTISFEQGNVDTIYSVSLAVTNGCGTIEEISPITVFPLPVVVFGTNVDDGCSPLEIEFSNISVGNPETYEWFLDGIFMSSDSVLQNQIFTTPDTAITVYEIALIISNSCGSDTLLKEIIVYPPNISAFIHVDTTSGCQPLVVNFSNFATPGSAINWDFGDGNFSFEANPVHTYDSAGTFIVYQYATNCGTAIDSIVIEVLPAPLVDFRHSSYVCDGQPIIFYNESIGINGSEWNFGDGNVSVLDSPTHIFDTPGEYTITLTGYSNLNNCPATFESTLTVQGNPDVEFSASVTDGCAPLSIDFSNTSTGSIYYEWDFGNGEVTSEESPQNQFFATPSTYNITLVGIDSFGCFSDTSIINIIVHDIPLAGFSTNSTTFCSGVDSIFTINNTQGASQYFWTFGNSSVIEAFEPSLAATDTANLMITMVAQNAFGCQDTAFNNVEILEPPIAAAPTINLEGCSPFQVQFNNESTNANTFLWYLGENNNTSTNEAPSYVYNTPGDYTATMIAMNTNGCPNDTLNFNITTYSLPISDFSLNANEICGFLDPISVSNNSSNATDYYWNFDNGNTSTLFEPLESYLDTGSYDVSLITTNQFGCQDTSFQELIILASPQAAIATSAIEACEPATFDFMNGSSYSDEFEWNFGDGNTNTSILNPAYTYFEEGVYQLILTANNSNECPSDSDTLIITALPKPISHFELSDTIFCGIPATTPITNYSEGANDYFWDFNNNTTSILTHPTVVYQSPNEYIINLIATNTFGCRDTTEQLISVNLQPQAGFEPGLYSGCEEDIINFINTTSDADEWLWNFGDSTTSMLFSPSHIYPEAGLYDVSLIAIYNETCYDTISISNAISLLPSPEAQFSYIDLGDGKIAFTNESINAEYFEWDFGNGDFSEEISPFYEYSDNNNWEVILTAFHQNGCTGLDSMRVSPEVFYGLYLPNAMSPESGIGEARLFKPKGIGIASYTVQVYSPWGQLLWENSALDGEQPDGSWDGTFKNKIVPQGAYVWKAEVEYINHIRQVKTGTITVLR